MKICLYALQLLTKLLSIIVVHGIGRETHQSCITDASDTHTQGDPLENLLRGRINARIMRFNSGIKNDNEFPSPDDLTQIAGVLLDRLSAERRERAEMDVSPIHIYLSGRSCLAPYNTISRAQEVRSPSWRMMLAD